MARGSFSGGLERLDVKNATSEQGMSAERLTRVTALIEHYIRTGQHYGAEILVARDGRIALHEVLGTRGPGQSAPLEKGAVYSIFSVSKTFTSILALTAIEKGWFSLTTRSARSYRNSPVADAPTSRSIIC